MNEDTKLKAYHNDTELLKTSIEKGEKIIRGINDNEVKRSMSGIIQELK